MTESSDLGALLRDLTPQVLGILVRRGAEFAAAEDAVQEAMIEALTHWPDRIPEHPRSWLVTVARRKLIDALRSSSARERRELRAHLEPEPGPTERYDDTLLLLSRCCHPRLTSASAIALTLRAVGGLTTAQIADAFMVPEATMAQRISRARRTVAGQTFDQPGEISAVLRVLYLIFNEGFGGTVDLAEEAIRLTRQLAASADDAEVGGLLALMLLHHARRGARRTASGAVVPLAAQDRTLWDTVAIAEGVDVLQAALARDDLGEYQAQAAIAALHDDAASPEETDWPQILEWYDELLRLAPSPIVALNRAVAVGQVDGPLAGMRAVEGLPVDLPRRDAVLAWLHETAGNLPGGQPALCTGRGCGDQRCRAGPPAFGGESAECLGTPRSPGDGGLSALRPAQLSSQPRNASRLAVDSPRSIRHSHSLRIDVSKPSSRIVLNAESA